MDDTETIIISKSGQRNKLRLLHVRRDELAQRCSSCLRTAVGSTFGSSHVYAGSGCALVWWLGCQLGGRDWISSWRGDFSFSFTIVSRSVLGLSPSVLSGTKGKVMRPQHEKDHQPPLVPRLSTHAAVPSRTLLRLTFRISIGLTSDGIKFAIEVGWLQFHYRMTPRLLFCDITIVPTPREMTSHAACWPTSSCSVKYPYMVGEGFRAPVNGLLTEFGHGVESHRWSAMVGESKCVLSRMTANQNKHSTVP
jgi:hypothetical protein